MEYFPRIKEIPKEDYDGLEDVSMLFEVSTEIMLKYIGRLQISYIVEIPRYNWIHARIVPPTTSGVHCVPSGPEVHFCYLIHEFVKNQFFLPGEFFKPIHYKFETILVNT